MSFRLYDYINRVFVKNSNLNIDFLAKYDNSIGYTIGKLGKIVEKLTQNEKLCHNPQVRDEDDNFKTKILEQKKMNANMFKSISVDERPLIVSEDLEEAGKFRFTFPELDKSVVVRNLRGINPPTQKSGSPPTPNEAVKNMVKFSDEVKASHSTDNPDLLAEIKNTYNYKNPNAPENWKYEHVNSSYFPGKPLEDYINLFCIKRPIKHKGKTFAGFRDCMLDMRGEKKVSSTDFEPDLKTHSKGYGKSTMKAEQDKPMKFNLPMAKKWNRMNTEINFYTLSPKHCI